MTRRTTPSLSYVLFFFNVYPCVLSSFPGLSSIVFFVFGYPCSPPPPPSRLPINCSEMQHFKIIIMYPSNFFKLFLSFYLAPHTISLPSSAPSNRSHDRQATDGQAVFPITTPFSDLNAYINNVTSTPFSCPPPILSSYLLPCQNSKKPQAHTHTNALSDPSPL